jgi:hypothetical protein
MIIDVAPDGWERIWKCIGCGREIFADAARQAETERDLARVGAEQTRPVSS